MDRLGPWSRRQFVRRTGGLLGTVALAGGAGTLLAACGEAGGPARQRNVSVPGPSDATGTIKVWGFNGTDPLNVTAKSRYDAFHARFPNVTLEFTPGGVDRQKFLSAAAAGSPPDLLYVPRADVTSYATRGALLALDDYVSAARLDMGQYRKPAVSEVTVGGKLYAIPEFTNVIVAYVNNRALRDAGLTLSDVDLSDWEKMADLNRKLTRSSGAGLQRAGYDPRLPEFTPLWAAANGGAILSQDGRRAVMDSRQTVEAVKYGVGLRQAVGGQQAYQAFAQAWDTFGARNQIVTDQIGIVLYEQFFMTSLGKVTPDADFTVLPFSPHRNGKQQVTYMTGNGWAIPKGASNAGVAMAFARFMTDPDTWVLSARANVATFAPPRVYAGTYTANSVADQRILKEVYQPSGRKSFDDGVRTVLGVQDHAVILPPSIAGKEVTDAMTDGVNAALLGRQDVEAALKSANQRAQQALHPAAGG
jgi:multiple sugar transport system substrate-binding protein